jgi:fructuronate reductase
MDGSQKLPQRWLCTVRDRLAQGQPIERLALAVAAWLQFLQGQDEQGRALPLDDPMATVLRAALASPSGALGFAPVFGDLRHSAAFVAAVQRQALQLRSAGVLAAINSL